MNFHLQSAANERLKERVQQLKRELLEVRSQALQLSTGAKTKQQECEALAHRLAQTIDDRMQLASTGADRAGLCNSLEELVRVGTDVTSFLRQYAERNVIQRVLKRSKMDDDIRALHGRLTNIVQTADVRAQ
ncbi:hypothetical protein CALVIDRAFT_431731 [Calocera viscosa TUFC12733]|uniref:Uncharacterized protein n=1 Tax=Calocera viscosa (strain TUFC12733) TaxID=1330018 RepID=A0A167FYI3_CALVF|nr:hypothetical protein CALVIDRAFT_431731 [Calocera viscosa TUFC12733]